MRNVFDTIYESCYALIEGILRDMDIYTETATDYKKRKTKVLGLKSPLRFKFPNGSQIIFKGMDNPEKVKSIFDVSMVWFEECSEIKYAAILEVMQRVRPYGVDRHFIFSCNPVGRENWVYNHYFVRTIDGTRITIMDEKKLYEKKNKSIRLKNPLRFRFPNGSQIIFKGMDNPEKVKSIFDEV